METTGELSQGRALLSARETAEQIYGCSLRTFNELRKKGLVPAPRVLGPRLLKWVRSEVEAAVANLPTAGVLAEPKQLATPEARRKKQQRLSEVHELRRSAKSAEGHASLRTRVDKLKRDGVPL